MISSKSRNAADLRRKGHGRNNRGLIPSPVFRSDETTILRGGTSSYAV
jgi:hypothetical protein